MEEGMYKHEEIVDYIIERGFAGVNELSERFNISASTVRRTLAAMEKKKLLSRYHGGAIVIKTEHDEPPIQHRNTERMDQKKAIGKAASNKINDNETILMLGGSTVASICPYIKNKANLTVITDSILVLKELIGDENITLIFLGGMLNRSEQIVEGYLTGHSMDLLRADKVFMGAHAIDCKRGIMLESLDHLQTFRMYLRDSDEAIIVADSSKFLSRGIAVLAQFDTVDTIITDSGIADNVIKELQQMGVDVIIAE